MGEMCQNIPPTLETEMWFFDAHIENTGMHKIENGWSNYWTTFTKLEGKQLQCPCRNIRDLSHDTDARAGAGAHVRLKTCVVLSCEEFKRTGHCDLHRMKYAYAVLPMCNSCNRAKNDVVNECIAVPVVDPSMEMYVGYYDGKTKNMKDNFLLTHMTISPISGNQKVLSLASLEYEEIAHILDERYDTQQPRLSLRPRNSLREFLQDNVKIQPVGKKSTSDLRQFLEEHLDGSQLKKLRNSRHCADKSAEQLSVIVRKRGVDTGIETELSMKSQLEILRYILVQDQIRIKKHPERVVFMSAKGKALTTFALHKSELLYIGSRRFPDLFPTEMTFSTVKKVVETFKHKFSGVSDGGFSFGGVNIGTGLGDGKVSEEIDSDKHDFLKTLVRYRRIMNHEDDVWRAACKPITVHHPIKPTSPIPPEAALTQKATGTEIQETSGIPTSQARSVEGVAVHELMLLTEKATVAAAAAEVAFFSGGIVGCSGSRGGSGGFVKQGRL
eukprot:CAMPEP_0181377168 /NCGR_PEP_ID=MMETSP1106-20121128/17741_1 /TAXON_ID=81844 /ORGANISM="Mantoniella antarctica, Strain SL-175" /LENGTH=498 /DNA_ID=CAMNT_0023495861 /DNA_START=279 /DNA_END=1775 /DNA_ORIENTATION=-